MSEYRELRFDLLVVGSGMSGMAASFFAAREGLSVVQVGHYPSLINHTGTMDLMSRTPLQGVRVWKNPLKGIRYLTDKNHDHPYAKIEPADIKESLTGIKAVLNKQGLKYMGSPNQNRSVLTSLGTIKSTCLVPETMWSGEKAMKQNKKGLIVDIEGLRGFSSKQITETIKSVWPNLKTAKIHFPGIKPWKEAVPETLARSMENSETLQMFAQEIKPYVGNAEIVGLPAILGINNSRVIHKNLVNMLGVSVFEIPSMPPSIPGMRLNEILGNILREEGVTCFQNRRVESIIPENGRFLARFDNNEETITINTESLVIASGRFLGKGLSAEDEGIKETLLNLPVEQPSLKTHWFRSDFFNRAGHGFNRTGIVTDRFFRPVKNNLEVLYPNLYTVGSINAGQDWVREKSGSGLAVATAYKAIQGIKRYRRKRAQ
jgi:glycerol-3-phosphate dehydrogenase subunit B